MKDAVNEAHRRKLQEIASDYEARGYRVVVEPGATEVPPFLTGFHPDIIAYGPQESVIVEVKAGAERATSERYRGLAEIVREHPGWRFSLVVTAPGVDDIAPATQQLLDRDAIMDRLTEAQELLRQGAKDAAFVLLWSSAEALVRHIASREDLPLERVPSSAVLKELFSLGLLSRNGLDIALRAFSIRNSLVHGFETPELDAILEELSSLLQELLAEYDQAESQAM